MNLIDYTFLNNRSLRLNFSNGRSIWVNLDVNSGRIVTRLKRNTISNVQHTGIWLGTDIHTGVSYILHNHYLQGSAHITDYQTYAAGQEAFWKDDVCMNDWLEVLEIALNHVVSRKRYNWLDYNCQTFTNSACHNRSRSEDVEKWGRLAFGFLAIALAAGFVTRAS